MALSLKVSALDGAVVKTMYFDPSDVVFDTLRKIRERIPEAHSAGNPAEFGLFLADDDPKKGVWLENGRPLEYYLLRSGDLLEYRKKARFVLSAFACACLCVCLCAFACACVCVRVRAGP